MDALENGSGTRDMITKKCNIGESTVGGLIRNKKNISRGLNEGVTVSVNAMD